MCLSGSHPSGSQYIPHQSGRTGRLPGHSTRAYDVAAEVESGQNAQHNTITSGDQVNTVTVKIRTSESPWSRQKWTNNIIALVFVPLSLGQ